MPKVARGNGLLQRLNSPSQIGLIGLNLVAYVLLFRWASENIHLGKLADYFSQIPAWAIVGTLLLNLLVLALTGYRLALYLGREFLIAFSITNIGYALNILLPLRLGDAIKIYLSHRLFKIPLIGIFAASVAEKLTDMVTILLLGAVVLVFASSAHINVGTILSISILAILGVGAVALFRRNIVFIVKLLPRGSRIRRILIELHKRASSYPPVHILLATCGIWTLHVFIVYFSFNTYLPEVRISIFESIALLVVMALAIAIPSAPAGLGLFEAGIVVYLTQTAQIANEAALAAATIFHLAITLPQLMVTAWLLWGRSGAILKVKTVDSVS
jgi:hypothetical protein